MIHNNFAIWRLGFILFLVLLLESTWPASWPHPDFILLITVPLSLIVGSQVGAIFAFTAGLGLGLFTSDCPAFPALAYGLAAFFVGFFGQYRQRFYIYLIAMALSIVAVDTFLIVISHFGWGLPRPEAIRSHIFSVLLWNTLLLWPAIRCVSAAVGERWLERLEL